ncbi:toll/interleukin-1 receptor domain-containing protein [Solirubrobacter ginsenosidimutans]|uniref:Toll/interleukin-1 receptor domain-containing protein n=1 Tax=Solirubrobacter ginsenosidimutans TaxID=490573 RepID=A0A9X3MP52_9ACTN|nr:toll/interleukin-1 receptor domain-containing protein [Solirubrobacter ginsenosidimutans]MDA0159262.1 toll/interleukin-1 receptor domain-containing protein [Solirubrobacter ginsenosidimutans]
MEPDFFISYTGADKSWAEWIAWQLEGSGYTVVLQAWDFTPGRDWVHEMQTAVASARRTIAVLSEDYFRSVHGEAEWRAAYASDPTGEQGILVPVRVAPCDPPGLLKTRIFVDLVGLDEDAARAALAAGLAERRAKPTLEPAFPGRASPAFPPAPASATHSTLKPAEVDAATAHLRKLLGVHERNVRILEEQEARFAGAAPVHLLGQLEDERHAAAELRRRLEIGELHGGR